MRGRGVKIRTVERVPGARFRQQLEPAPTSFALDPVRDNLVHIVSGLTRDIERFESIVDNERQILLQNAPQAGAFDDYEFRPQSTRVTVAAAEVATRARGALEELQRLSRAADHNPFEVFEHHRSRGLSEDQPAG